MWDSVVELVSLVQSTNDIGDTLEVEERTEVFCCEKSIGQSEFYQAHAVGLKPTVKITVKQIDYKKERIAYYEGDRYNVLRTYKSNREDIELTLEGDVNGNT